VPTPGQASQVTESVSGQYVNAAALPAETEGQGYDSRAPVSETQVGYLPKRWVECGSDDLVAYWDN